MDIFALLLGKSSNWQTEYSFSELLGLVKSVRALSVVVVWSLPAFRRAFYIYFGSQIF